MSLPGARLTTCRGEGCGQKIMFVKTANSRMPVNPDIDENGNVAVYRDGNGNFVGHALKKGEEPQPFERRMMPHIATCSAVRKSTPRPDNVIPLSRGRELKAAR